MSGREVDVLVWGATGYTGALVCQWLAARGGVTWGIAGRSRHKLEARCAELQSKYHLSKDQPNLYVADVNDQQSMEKMAAKSKCLISVAGPFTLIGEAALKACIKTVTHYVDATAELPWVSQMLTKYHEEALEQKLKVIPCCAFDFVPNDMMMFQLERYLKETKSPNSLKKFSDYPREVTHAFTQTTPMVSGGTARSGMAIFRSLPTNRVVDYYIDPYAMVPSTHQMAFYDSTKKANSFHILPSHMTSAYCTPFVMSSLMHKYIHWSNFVQKWRWGPQLIYHGGERHNNIFKAYLYSLIIWLQFFLAYLLSKFPTTWKYLPQPGTGPVIDVNNAWMTSDLEARVPAFVPGAKEKVVRIKWVFRHGEAYMAAAVFIAEAAILISQQNADLPKAFGITTPSAALGQAYLDALRTAGIEMNEESDL
eukprot:Gregarina_sp_Poly_1__770@NODE_1184_length_4843_cov_219_562814_g814_i0_p2_GENE_NODE_1184_length_4843_cov_219_562814_g814_i0NODE_1184_length_4843_cov_219_562814_g814_i0_p2_ORF_typecomplete_len430_score63_02Sacchrp_dh_NADP/PF03435_18/2_1e31NAD_binding_10/PF13460_6/3_7e06adh_short/PF00106_25/7_8e06NmrA/PF05368_13/2_1e05NmrA/PF05368_13/3_4e03KR/PF08659_10/1_5e053Beta_HSD/PF01073_19/4e05Epimerase/PF01370_21/4_4e05GDP_Man_Dehyd/PF16363_5/8_2e05Polysacc_synt_2/PF02719_15/0_013Shikimate_DH/PF01488_20/0_0